MLKQTARGTRYLTAPECQIIASTKINPAFFSGDSDGFVRELFPRQDASNEPQYAARYFNEQRSNNAQAAEYLAHIKQSGHGSVLLAFLTVRSSLNSPGSSAISVLVNRAGFGFSQVSQRYVAGKHLRFVESLVTQWEDPRLETSQGITDVQYLQFTLHENFERWIDASQEQYERREALLLRRASIDYKTATTEQRKAARQEVRRCLPNDTEAAIVVTGNLRAWRHFIEQRCSKWADAEACRAAHTVFVQLQTLEPILWEDYVPGESRTDGLPTLHTPYRKV